MAVAVASDMSNLETIDLDLLVDVSGGFPRPPGPPSPPAPPSPPSPPSPGGPTTGDRVKGCLAGAAVSGLTNIWRGPWGAGAAAVGGCIAGAIMPTGKAE